MNKNGQTRDEDPVVKEIRAIRSALWRKGGGTGKGFLKVVRDEAAATRRPSKTSRTKRKSKK